MATADKWFFKRISDGVSVKYLMVNLHENPGNFEGSTLDFAVSDGSRTWKASGKMRPNMLSPRAARKTHRGGLQIPACRCQEAYHKACTSSAEDIPRVDDREQ